MTQNIRLFGGSAVLDEQYTRQADWDISLAGQFNYVYDFETEPSTTLEAGVSAYSSWQDKQSQIDTTLFELQAVLTVQVGKTESLNIVPHLFVESDGGGVGSGKVESSHLVSFV